MVAEHITNRPCTKHSGKRTHTQMLVVHSIESPLTAGYATSVTDNWLGRWYDGNGALIEASSNVVCGPDTLVRSVHTDYAAWHASWANSLSIGYEQTGYAAYTRTQWLTGPGKDQVDRLAREMAMDAKAYGIPLVWLTQTQVNAIASGNRTIKGLVTHSVIDPSNRTDPGSQYPYDILLDTIRAYSGAPAKPTTKPQEDTLSAAEVKEIKNYIHALAIGGYESGGKKHPGFAMVAEENQRRIGRIAKDVWGTKIRRAKGSVSALQELADANTAAQSTATENAALRSVLDQLAEKQGVAIDYAKVEAAAQAGARRALAEGVDIEATVAFKDTK